VIHAQAFTKGFQDAFMIIAFTFICALVPAWILGRKRARRCRADQKTSK
jgi:hypothetical protein